MKRFGFILRIALTNSSHNVIRNIKPNSLIINHRKNLLCPLEFRFYLSSAGCLYVCIYLSMYVISIVATPLKVALGNFGITFLIGLSKKGFLNFLKKLFFCRVIALFLYFFKISL